jgi:predicted AAA+ superfamily ATPase
MIKRFIFNRLREEISQPEINILLGPRPVGKTTLLRHLEKTVRESGLKSGFFDLEQPQVLAKFNVPDDEIIEMMTGHGEDVVFIDEFQYLANGSKIFKAIFDAPKKIKIICSGSSALEIHKHIKESLAGRRFLFQIYPLQFAEIKAYRKDASLPEYLRYGGLPGLTHTESEERKQQMLTELLGAYILKDIKSLLREENIRAFNHLLYLLAQNQGGVISASGLANDIHMSTKAISRYLDILEATYTAYRVYSYSNNIGNELKKSCKVYLYDLGIRNAILKDFSSLSRRPDKGSILESFVFLQLKTNLLPNMEIKFWRTKEGDEVDFILLKDRKPLPIEVKSNMDSAVIPKGIQKFLARYPQTAKALVINEHISEISGHGNCAVRFMTFEEFSSSTLPW